MKQHIILRIYPNYILADVVLLGSSKNYKTFSLTPYLHPDGISFYVEVIRCSFHQKSTIFFIEG
jgi:hypothetical protein